ncbi:type I polyketide synthase [Pseudoalteromonas byunsanensis]|uniref:Uncharacterized protein n=1 Tax=Pseudoalteromonas byunsanensis TaxID=327939 RepID=A0A1S1N7L2_9GAMM|nr:type I polyketide synthase [Pseudoalteromonas byunsanensis]OHU95398.1 hypothetical protein BIW53_11855 [Pseudoalteromonas byunsanensis]
MSQYKLNTTQNDEQALPEEVAVAVIGMAGQFPGAENVGEFWDNLSKGVESIARLSDEDLRRCGISDELLNNKSYVKAGAYLKNSDMFDPEFFDMTPKEAEITDPQHRVLLECAHDAMSDAGYVAEQYDGAVSVYAGIGVDTYLLGNIMPNPQILNDMGMYQLVLGNDKCYAVSRISYKLNLTGASLLVDTSCSTSLVSIVMAYKSLLSYDCDMALAGGAKVNASEVGYLYEPGSVNSPDGHCRAFDAQASGTVFGNGVGLLLMKRLEDAIEDKDNIIGIIRGGAINNDGSDKVGFTAPSVAKQRDVIEQALEFSEVPAQSISYVEAHGTGTRLGDPVEIGALNEAFADCPAQSCYIGSVKTNVGHLETAAGVTGVIKTLLSMKNDTLPATLNYETPNPAINIEQTPFKVVAQNTPWARTDSPRRACVSSFGIGGTNAHIILEESPEREYPTEPGSELLLLSAKCAKALKQSQHNLSAALPQVKSLQDAAYTLAVGRKAYAHRSYAAVNDKGAVTFAPANELTKSVSKVAWVVPGQGTQYVGMSRDLHQRFDVFRSTFEQCCELIVRQGGQDIRNLLLGETAEPSMQELIMQTDYAQPAIFVHAYAMAKQLQAMGVEPELMLGHSLGEYVVACLAGVMSLEDAIKLVLTRAQLMNKVTRGAMLSISASLDVVQSVLAQVSSHEIDICAINSSKSVVVGGTYEAIDSLSTLLQDKQIDNRKLVTSHAFHSHMLEPVLGEFEAAVRGITFHAPQMGYVSSLNGQLVNAQMVCEPQYWVQHLRHTVQFGNAVDTLISEGVDCVFDLGPSNTAAMLVRDNVTSACSIVHCAPNVKQKTAGDLVLLEAIGKYWSLGGNIDWQDFYANRDCYRTSLPGYPYQKRRCWIDPIFSEAAPQVAQQQTPVQTEPAKEPDVSDEQGAPRNATEAMIVKIWQQLLGVESIAITDNFFDLGGQSLLASRVISCIYEETGLEVDVSAIFESPTVEALASVIVEQQLSSTDSEELERLLLELEE